MRDEVLFEAFDFFERFLVLLFRFEPVTFALGMSSHSFPRPQGRETLLTSQGGKWGERLLATVYIAASFD